MSQSALFYLSKIVFGDAGEVTSVSVMEGDSVTLHINLAEIKQDDKIQWKSPSNHPIAEIDEKKIIYKEPNESFRGRLELNIQTGDLTIKNMRTKYAGPYKAVISRNIETSVNFDVKVNESSHADSGGTDEETVLKTKGESVTLNTGVQTQRGDLILWRFGDEGLLIAKDDKDNKSSIYDDDEGFRGRLKLDDRTGSLTISDVRSSDSGLYKLKISSNHKQTLYKTFSVYVSDGLSPAAIAGIVVCVLLAAAAAAVVIYYRHCISKPLAVPVEVFQAEDLTLPPDPKDMPTADEGEWFFGDKEIIAKFNKKNNKFTTYDNVLDERFKDKLKLNRQTGSLTIRNIKTRHSGLYKLKIISGSGPSFIHYNVIVMARDKSVHLGDSVTLKTGVTDIKTADEILWTFGPEDTRIARITGGINEPSYYYYTDGRFRDKLEMDNQTGDLKIGDIRTEHIGVYEVQTYVRGETRYKKFTINTSEAEENCG
ncbi:hypothetical protein IRJ41_010687 [Triplophysa rosa]|uniref:Immunoglobulin domain-containing protein n=1 Tax=Triplophysa rosa TaxID=992332 RepID=A0A9W7T2Y7_TRIRA|nr:hypothetical protein IRJ41_010687 [Triplophysa rosa]